jgi:hypothetical protein
MEAITNKLESLTIAKTKVLYYSVVFDYRDIMNIVRDTLFKSTNSDDISNAYTKTKDSYELFYSKITEDTKKLLDSKFSAPINKIKECENFIVCSDVLFTANSEFHITTLFTGGKVHEKSADLESEMGKSVSVKINKLAVSGNFIVAGVESIKFSDGTDVSYFGNEIKHITIALNKTGKKVFPKDSYTALSDGKIHEVDCVINGTTSKVV